MKKSDLKPGMVIETRGKELFVFNGELGKYYDENLKFDCTTSNGMADIVRVYKQSRNNLIKIWEREKEIDWTKVPIGTKVRAKTYEGEEIKEAYFNYYDDFGEFLITLSKYSELELLNSIKAPFCEMHPSVKIEPDWYEERE